MLFNRRSSPKCSSLTRKGVRDPLTHNITDLRITNDILIRNQDMTTELSSLCFSANFFASAETNLVHS